MKTLFLRKQILPLFLLLMGIFLADSCTIQKRVHLGGYSIERKHHYKDTENQAEKEQDETAASGQKVQSEEESPVIKEESEQNISAEEEPSVIEPSEKVITEPGTVEQDDPKTVDITQPGKPAQKVVSTIVRSLVKRDGEESVRHLDSYARVALCFAIILAALIVMCICLGLMTNLGLLGDVLRGLGILQMLMSAFVALVLNLVFGGLSLNEIGKHPENYRPAWVTVLIMLIPLLFASLGILGLYFSGVF